MKKILTASLALVLSLSANASTQVEAPNVYKLDIQVFEHTISSPDYHSLVSKINEEKEPISKMTYHVEEGKQSGSSSYTDYPYIKDSQEKIGFFGKLFGDDYDYDTFKLGSSIMATVSPSKDPSHVILNYDYKRIKLNSIKTLETNGEIMEVPNFNESTALATVQMSLEKGKNCKVLTSVRTSPADVKEPTQSTLYACIEKLTD